MIVVKEQRNRRQRRPQRRLLLVAVVLALLTCVGIYLLYPKGEPVTLLYCDAEETISQDSTVVFATPKGNFSNGFTQDGTFARSGSYSSKTDNSHPFGMTFTADDLLPGEFIEISVYRKGDRVPMVVSTSWGVYESIFESSESSSDGWELLSFSLSVPDGLNEGTLRVYPWNNGLNPTWFDDMTIRRYRKGGVPMPELAEGDWSPEEINLIISDRGWKKLTAKRNAALKRGILFSSDDDWVKGRLEWNNGKRQASGKLRLKGDWTDHLAGNKWSYRVKLNSGQAWNRLTVFSLQNPSTRNFLDEWVYHQLLRQEDILTTRYDFVHLKINNQSRGLYAYEEHFVKQLPEYSKRREGPILKMDEGGFWELMDLSKAYHLPLLNYQHEEDAAAIRPFDEGRTLKDSSLAGQFQIAQSLLEQYRKGTGELSEIFDLNRMAKYFALIDVAEAYHGMIWHNMRFYYNPVTSKLEPIAFDGYTEAGAFNWMDRKFLGINRANRYEPDHLEANLYDRLFRDADFVEAYVGYLYRYTSQAWISAFVNSIRGGIRQREKFLQTEWNDYHYQFNYLTNRAGILRQLILPNKLTSLKVYTLKSGPNEGRYRAMSYHALPIRVVGVGNKPSGEPEYRLSEKPLIDDYNAEFPADYADVSFPGKGKYLFFEIPGIDSLFTTEIYGWGIPDVQTPSQEIFQGVQPQSNDFYEVRQDSIIFRRGRHQTDQAIIIPEGYRLYFSGGTELDFVKGAYLLSRSPVTMRGNEGLPILISSSDSSARGFTVLETRGKRNEMSYVVFSGLGNFTQGGWTLTGAVTFYESDVTLDQVRIANNHCEDALNIVRSNFLMMRSVIAYTFGDGFDADFCTGKVKDSRFYHTGNDATDFSGSQIEMIGLSIEHAGDKGISVGEESQVKVIDATVVESPLGVASKDFSTLTIENITLRDVEVGFAAYQKKPEYGPATITVKNYHAEGMGALHQIQAGSSLKLDDLEVKGNR